jgi:hypothetical protein
LDDEGHDHPIHYTSRQMASSKRNYKVTKKEGLAIMFALKKFHHYLLKSKVTIVTNHQTLDYFINKPNATRRIAWWVLLM